MAKSNKLTKLHGEHFAQARVLTIALGTDDEQMIWKNQSGRTVKVTTVTFTPDEAHTGAATNNMTLGVLNRGLAGLGTAVVAPFKEYASGVNLVKYAPDDIPVSAVAADVLVDDGEALSFDKVESGTGLAMPDGLVTISFEFQ